MILQQARMNMSVSGNSHIPKLVLLWEEVGLCMHKEKYYQQNKSQYIVSHFSSGKSVLRHIRDRKEAENAMQWMVDNVLEDWRFTLEEWDNYSVESRSIIKERIDALQNTILMNERNI